MWHFLSKNLHVRVYEHLRRSQKTNYGSCLLLSTMYALGWSSGRLAWQQRPLPPELSCQSYCDIFTPAPVSCCAPLCPLWPWLSPTIQPITSSWLYPCPSHSLSAVMSCISICLSESPPDACLLLYSETNLSVCVPRSIICSRVDGV